MRLLPAEARVPERWQNGRGQTATVDRGPDWRISVAAVVDAAPFSRFPSADRILMPLSEPGITLSVNGQRRDLAPFEPSAFAGEDAVCAVDVGGPAEVLNLIWQRTLARGELTILPVAGTVRLAGDGAVRLAGDGALIAVVTAGQLALAGGALLNRLDAVALEAGEATTVSGRGALALARFRSPGP